MKFYLIMSIAALISLGLIAFGFSSAYENRVEEIHYRAHQAVCVSICERAKPTFTFVGCLTPDEAKKASTKNSTAISFCSYWGTPQPIGGHK